MGGKNDDAEALAAKIAAKKAAKEAGEFQEKKGGGDKGRAAPKAPKVENMVNPHTGKRDAAYTQKMLRKSAA